MAKNYYLILGVSSDATLAEVKTAFRRRALELHPDHSGLESGPFLELQEAYGVLGDPERRRRYDLLTRPPPARRRPWGPSPEPLVSPRPHAEPLRSVDAATSFQEISLADSFDWYRPSFAQLFDRWWVNYESLARPKAERLESLTAEVVISPEAARLGGQTRLWIPTRATCPACGGGGAVEAYECWHCEGQGALTTQYPVDIEYPPGLRDGYTVRISLTRFGIENFYLVVVFRISGND